MLCKVLGLALHVRVINFRIIIIIIYLILPVKVKEAYLYSAYYELLISIQVWHVLTRDHTVLTATHTFIHKWNEP